MTLRYALMDPTGNRTILVETPVAEEAQPVVAASLMKLEPTAEQVGFLSRSEGCDISLRMAGGEFCGNAAMSAAAYYGIHTGLSKEQLTLRVSGATEPVTVQITARPEGRWQGIVQMPRPSSIETVPFSTGQAFPVVSFPGISHVILEQELPRAEAEKLARRWCDELGVEALGLMFLDRNTGRLTPLVYVPAADTLFWESACGSGSAAVGAWLAQRRGAKITVSLQQPGGVLEITAAPDGSLLLTGTVMRIYEKTAAVKP